MGKLQKLLQKNAVLHFLGSYFAVLTLPILIINVGILGVYRVMENENRNASLRKMEHSVQLIDNSLSALHSMAVQGISAGKVKRTAVAEQVGMTNILEFKQGIDALSSILLYQEQGIGFISEYYLYFNKTNYCFYETTLYKESIFDPKLEKWGIKKNDWLEKVVNKKIIEAQYVSCNGKLHYVMPINARNGENNGMLVFMLDTGEICSYFDYAKEIGEGILYVADKSGRVLFSNDANYTVDKAEILGLEEIQEKYSDYSLMTCTSGREGWTYYYWITNKVAASQTINFLVWSIIAELAVLAGCAYISVALAKKNGRPVDQMFELVASDTEENIIGEKSTEKLGEFVAGIVSSNQEMQEEIEESKPLLRKAFFHDLLTLDVASTKELQYLAENAGINIHSDEFWVLSVRLFSNNDVYDVDEQTLMDVKVIIRSMQKHIEDIIGQDVWFYQRNYLSLLILMDGQEQEQIMRMAEDTYQWLEKVFATESVWGISTKCSDIMNIWKHFEEAETARKCCNAKQQIVEYSPEVGDKNAFYFPEMAEEKIVNYMNAGDIKAIRDVLAILEHENLINRKLTRNGFIKLNNKICEMLSANLDEDDSMQYIMRLNNTIIENADIKGGRYFAILEKTFEEICTQSKRIKGQRQNELIDNIQEYIEQNYANPDLGLGTISVAFGISEGYVSSLFKKQTQIGFNEYVEKIRMGKAIDLLKEDSENIETIAAKVGYNSVQSFRRAFKRIYGTTPKNYR